jgi:CHASE1-domain containing sensor protein
VTPAETVSLNYLAQDRADTKTSPARSKTRARLPVIVTALAGLMLSLAATALLWQWEQKRSQQEFATIAQSHFLALQRGLDEYLDTLKALRALFEVSENVTRDQFEKFSSRLLAGQKAIQNLSWVPRVTGDR